MSNKPILPLPVLEHLATAVLVIGAELQVLYLNPAGEMLFQLSLKRARGLTVRDLVLNDDGYIDTLEHALHTNHPYSERERTLLLSLDRAVTVDCTMTPLNEPGQPTALLIELVSIDRQLRITREEQLISQQSATRALVRGMAHEIKNPLGGLRGAAQLLERELPNEDLKEYTKIIIGEADRLRNLVDRMLGPNNLPKRQEVNIHEVLERVRHLVSAEASEAVNIMTDYDPSIPALIADRDQLIQVVLNIVGNALQAVGEQGNITLRSRVQRQFTIGQIRHKLVASIQVIDDGPGITADVQEQIFYPMVSGRDKGSGLGLSIAQTLINQHGGVIEYSSKPGNTVFTLLIPLERIDHAN